jgi:uncharacterized protein (TIGR03643 family)
VLIDDYNMDPARMARYTREFGPFDWRHPQSHAFYWSKMGSEIGAERYNNDEDIYRIIQMAWEDLTPFEAIEFQFGLKEKEVIEFMRLNSKESSFRMWRKRVTGRVTKHRKLLEQHLNGPVDDE